MACALTHSVSSNALAAGIRGHFGLTQAELGRYLNVSSGYVAHLEAGRRRATPLANLRLARLARLLPPPEGTGVAAPPAPAYVTPAAQPLFGPELPLPGPLAAGPLQKRQRQCARRLALLRRDLYVLTDRAAAQERRRWALPVLEALLTPHPHDPAGATPEEQAHLRRWLAELAAKLPAAPARRPDAPTGLALLLVRMAALEAEAATLAGLPQGEGLG
ncbi:MAG TPA: helix-turn-helix transcriptional regulator [Hymenobacter sp.]|jgi:transcriptional regulator with XRE-family HTH domain|uniref:helix-turn-helix domain-containing protein n=1 Tax=Hymenobacter sp. TaxID=1898978 RepID=UPI002ED87E48